MRSSPLPSRLKPAFLENLRPFWFIASLSLAGYWLARFWFPLRPNFDRIPLPDVRIFTSSLGQGLAYAAWLSILFGLYWLAYRYVQQASQPPPLWLIMGTAVLFALPLLQTFPINATDVYRYVIRGRISSVYAQNPFAVPPNAISDDPFLPFAGEWAGATSPYGPLWEITATLITAISRENLLLGIVLFKLFGLIVFLGIGALIWYLLRDQSARERAGRTILWLWNPALLLMFVVDAHNDGLMLFWLLLGWWLVKRRRVTIGFVIMLLAPLTKPIGLLPLPFVFLSIWRQQPNLSARWRFLILTALGGLAISWLAFLPFGSPVHLLIRLRSEAAAGASFSLSALLLLLAGHLGANITPTLFQGTIFIFTAAFIGGYIFLAWLGWRGRSPLRGVADGFGAYLLLALNFRIWYTTWLFAWLLVDSDRGETAAFRLHAGVWLLWTAQLSVFVYGHLRTFAFGGNYFLAHLVGVPFTFALPLFLARPKVKG